MKNEFMLIGSLLFSFGAVLAAWRLYGKMGLYAMTVFCTLTANIEVIILVNAFGMEQTLGNTLFAASFLITDILSENESKEDANKAVNIGIFCSIAFILVSQSWLHYTPVYEDDLIHSIRTVFSNTPRVMLASLIVYAITQKIDVWLYHKIWNFTTKKGGDSRSFLWLRNNGSTLTSQFLNTLLFTLGAFFGIYDAGTLVSILLSSYLIYIITSLCDTPAAYIARKIKGKTQQ